MTSPTAPADVSTFVAHDAADLLAMAPIVLGFHPEESVVLLTFGGPRGGPRGESRGRSRGGAGFHARVDLPIRDADRDETVSLLVDAAKRNQVVRAAVLVLSKLVQEARAVGTQLGDALLDAGVEVIDVVRADGEQWWAVRPGDEGEPAHDIGPGEPYDLRSHRFTAERVFEGRAALPGRDDLEASVAPLVGEAADADRAEIARLAVGFADALFGAPGPSAALVAAESARWLRRQVLRRASQPDDAPTPPMSAAVAARICVLALCPPCRDVVCTLLTREAAVAQLPLWTELTRRAPEHLAEGVSSLLALTAWLVGDGALSWCAIDRCHACASGDPSTGIRLADLVGDLLQGAVCPDEWQPLDPVRVSLLAS